MSQFSTELMNGQLLYLRCSFWETDFFRTCYIYLSITAVNKHPLCHFFKIFLKRYVGRAEHWIGLKNAADQTWKWSNGKEFDNWYVSRCFFIFPRLVARGNPFPVPTVLFCMLILWNSLKKSSHIIIVLFSSTWNSDNKCFQQFDLRKKN